MNGDRAGRLYAAFGPAIYARCLGLLGERAAAEDATQEVFLKAYRHLQDPPDDPDSYAWIYRVATNLCLSMIRDRKPHGELDEDLVNGGPALDELVVDRDLARRVIDRSPSKYKLPAWLHFVDGMSLEEVARTLGVTSRTVHNRLGVFLRNARKFVGRVER